MERNEDEMGISAVLGTKEHQREAGRQPRRSAARNELQAALIALAKIEKQRGDHHFAAPGKPIPEGEVSPAPAARRERAATEAGVPAAPSEPGHEGAAGETVSVRGISKGR